MPFGTWFRLKGHDAKWLEKSPANRTSRCDNAWQHVVAATEPRLVVDTGRGPTRKRGKGKKHEYLCVGCAFALYEAQPPPRQVDGQERLFDES